MSKNLPWYVTRFEVIKSMATDDVVAGGLVTTGPNAAKFVSVKGATQEVAKAEFLRAAEAAYMSGRV